MSIGYTLFIGAEGGMPLPPPRNDGPTLHKLFFPKWGLNNHVHIPAQQMYLACATSQIVHSKNL